MGHFQWKPNFFIVFVAPPGVISKSTTANVGMGLLRSCGDEIFFGPESATWQALTEAFIQAETPIPEIGSTMSAITIVASELGTFLDPKNREMLDVLNDIWDGRNTPWTRRTKGEGETKVSNPWLNFIGCTTPSWIQENFPQYAIGGGFTSRTIFVWGDAKRRLIAYPMDEIADETEQKHLKHHLINDLKRISRLAGEYTLSPDAKAWGVEWYTRHWGGENTNVDRTMHGGYIARKQTHLHKLALILTAAKSDKRVIELNEMIEADKLITKLELGLNKVFAAMAANRDVACAATLLKFFESHPKGMSKDQCFRKLMGQMSFTEFTGACAALTASGQLKELARPDSPFLFPTNIAR